MTRAAAGSRIDADEVLADVAAAVSLAEGDEGVRAIVRVVAQRGHVAVREIALAAGLPVPVVAAAANELRKRGIVDATRPVKLTPRGRELFAALALRLPDGRCDVCDRSGIRIPRGLESATVALTELAAAAPAAEPELDQSHCTVATKLRRVLALEAAGALFGRHVLLIGDDDLVSLAIAEVLRSAGVERGLASLTVVDVDRRLLEFLRIQLADAPFPTNVVAHDARDQLPFELHGSFDTVCTDPPYTPAGARVFLSRAVEATGARPGRTIFFSFGRRRPAETLEIQRTIAELELVIARLVPQFNEYVGAGVLGGRSDLYELTTTARSAPLDRERYAGALYTGEVRDPTRMYVCAACGSRVRVGPREPVRTVQALKDAGCPTCGGRSFRPLARGGGR